MQVSHTLHWLHFPSNPSLSIHFKSPKLLNHFELVLRITAVLFPTYRSGDKNVNITTKRVSASGKHISLSIINVLCHHQLGKWSIPHMAFTCLSQTILEQFCQVRGFKDIIFVFKDMARSILFCTNFFFYQYFLYPSIFNKKTKSRAL